MMNKNIQESLKRWFKEKIDLSIKTISCGLTL